MLLSCRLLTDVANVNLFKNADTLRWTDGDTVTVYLQLIDASADRPEQGFVPSGRRYVPTTGATLSVTFDSLDSAKAVTKTATQPFAGDLSIWSVPVTASDKVRGTVNVRLLLTESAVVTRGILQAAVLVSPQQGF